MVKGKYEASKTTTANAMMALLDSDVRRNIKLVFQKASGHRLPRLQDKTPSLSTPAGSHHHRIPSPSYCSSNKSASCRPLSQRTSPRRARSLSSSLRRSVPSRRCTCSLLLHSPRALEARRTGHLLTIVFYFHRAAAWARQRAARSARRVRRPCTSTTTATKTMTTTVSLARLACSLGYLILCEAHLDGPVHSHAFAALSYSCPSASSAAPRWTRRHRQRPSRHCRVRL